ncbi:hypothetical protein MUP77_21320 [Candidatus Bathyarchaeota archaeon]|nr:hypothetical protein [Candidatus Bathyarchaeota archaeon]
MYELDRGKFLGLVKSAIVIVGIIATLLATSGVTYGFLTNSLNVSNTGIITSANVGVYTTQQCTANLTQISWGLLSPGCNYTKAGYIRNNGGVDITLSMSTSSWSPAAAATSLGVSWNYGGQTIIPGQVLAVIWKLSVPSNIAGIQSFSFNIAISGSG